MPRTSDLDVKRWKERLRFADEVWKHHGLAKGAPNTDVLDYLKAYRNQQWKSGFGGIPRASCITVNMVFSVTNTLMASLNARHPIVDVTAENPDSMDAARRQEVLVNFLIRQRKLRIKREMNRALRDALLLPFGMVRHGYMPAVEVIDGQGDRIESFGPAQPDLPYIRRTAAWDVRIDPESETFDPDVARWVAFRTLHPKSEIERNPRMHAPRDLKATVSLDKLMLYPEEMQKFRSQETPTFVEVWTIYDRMHRTWLAISPGSEKPLRDEDDWPIAWENLPYNILQFNEQADDPFGVAYPTVYFGQQMELNKVRTITNELVKRLRRVIFVNGQRLPEQERAKLYDDPDLSEFLETDGSPNDAVMQIQMGGLDQTLLLYAAQIEEDVRKLVGVGDMNRAQRINVESATEASNVAAGQQIQTGRNQGPFEDFVADVIDTFGTTLQQTLTEEIAVPILGATDARELLEGEAESPFLTIGPEQIRGEFIYEIRPGSMIPRDPNDEARRAMAWLQVAGQYSKDTSIPQALLDVARALDKDPAKALIQGPERIAVLEAAARQRDQQQMMGEEAPDAAEKPSIGADLAQLLSERARGGMQ